ncbi:eukaryotic membrane protein family-domain-containing protein [Lipomyces japonicus]|uniref:eukaryotic membrane protein family-domain-containing protein n=1 Tax=Lipomyces japonicus TaxID=56871 RepID=UPI0034CED9E1
MANHSRPKLGRPASERDEEVISKSDSLVLAHKRSFTSPNLWYHFINEINPTLLRPATRSARSTDAASMATINLSNCHNKSADNEEDEDVEDEDAELERIVSFLKVPLALEQAMTFGFMTCLDAFLYVITILPVRCVVLAVTTITAMISVSTSKPPSEHHQQRRWWWWWWWQPVRVKVSVPVRLSLQQQVEILKAVIIVSTIYLLTGLNGSMIYHNIRGQSAVKLYVMFNVLEIGDKLLCSIGLDIHDILFSARTLRRPVRMAVLLAVAVCYNGLHAAALYCQMITLNVAVNSYSNALLTLLLSNQFSEIKSTVFKKFDRENLFQLACADTAERFQLWVMMLVIGLRNLVQIVASSSLSTLSSSSSSSSFSSSTASPSASPRSWTGINSIAGALLSPAIVVLGSEVCVDWLKHAYVAKFNMFRPIVYDRFLDVFAKDYVHSAAAAAADASSLSSSSSSSSSLPSGGHNVITTKRLGVPIIPLVCVFIKTAVHSSRLLLSSSSSSMSSSSAFLSFRAIAAAGNRHNDVSSFAGNSSGNHNLLVVLTSSLIDTIEIGAFGLILFAMFAVLVLVKVVLGVALLEYATTRLRRRHQVDRENEHDDGIMHDVSDEKLPGEIKGGVWGLVDMTGNNIRNEINSLSQAEVKDDANRSQDRKRRAITNDLQLVNRFQMVAKRIW